MHSQFLAKITSHVKSPWVRNIMSEKCPKRNVETTPYSNVKIGGYPFKTWYGCPLFWWSNKKRTSKRRIMMNLCYDAFFNNLSLFTRLHAELSQQLLKLLSMVKRHLWFKKSLCFTKLSKVRYTCKRGLLNSSFSLDNDGHPPLMDPRQGGSSTTSLECIFSPQNGMWGTMLENHQIAIVQSLTRANIGLYKRMRLSLDFEKNP